jgi:N-acetylmuramoyl-L-alanine amidase
MHINQWIGQYLKRHPHMVRAVAWQLVVTVILGLVLLGTTFGSSVLGAFAQAPCANGDQSYRVASGDTLGVIAARYNTNWQTLASYNHLANANMLQVNQNICIPGTTRSPGTSLNSGPQTALTGSSNNFPYGQCTWWASQRYFQLHGVYVPWKTDANAWQWADRAHDYDWHVSSQPVVGAIVVLQPGVQGAYSLGHVGVVESLSNGTATVSNMNWGASPSQITDSQIYAGPGVSFISIR